MPNKATLATRNLPLGSYRPLFTGDENYLEASSILGPLEN